MNTRRNRIFFIMMATLLAIVLGGCGTAVEEEMYPTTLYEAPEQPGGYQQPSEYQPLTPPAGAQTPTQGAPFPGEGGRQPGR